MYLETKGRLKEFINKKIHKKNVKVIFFLNSFIIN